MRILQVLLVLIILGLQLRLWSGAGSLAEISRLNDSIAEQESENTGLQSRNDELLREVEELKTGTDVIEEMAREELGLIKDGETFYMILDSDDSTRNQETVREQRARQQAPNQTSSQQSED
ncbi:septum formation initiator family protein [Gammaproteobacteria bacterium]|nr:septum formation initiator family protein [Gammaproteobacteria bacterium]